MSGHCHECGNVICMCEEIKRAERPHTNKIHSNQEPVAWHDPDAYGSVTTYKQWALEHGWKPLYTAPQQREWIGLTVNEAQKFYEKYTDREELIYAIDKFLEEKNSG